jgi:hypothetical protein
MKAEVKLEKATCFVIFYGEEKLPPYKITNWTSYPLTIYQKVHFPRHVPAQVGALLKADYMICSLRREWASLRFWPLWKRFPTVGTRHHGYAVS